MGDGQFATFFGGENRRSETVRLTDRPSERFVGALRTVVYHAAWGLAALSIYPSGVRIAGNFRPINLLVPVWEAGFDEIQDVSVDGNGIRLTPQPHPSQWIIFQSSRRDEILASLAAHGLTIPS